VTAPSLLERENILFNKELERKKEKISLASTFRKEGRGCAVERGDFSRVLQKAGGGSTNSYILSDTTHLRV